MNSSRTRQPPQFCDYGCPHAAFTQPDASGACRREQAIWCNLAKKHNNKNARCLFPPAANAASGMPGGGKRKTR